MKRLFVFSLLIANLFFWVDAKSLGHTDVLEENMEQSLACAEEMGPSIKDVPKIHFMDPLPEDSEALNKLWGCIWKKKMIINEHGVVNEAVFKQHLIDLFSIVDDPSQEQLDDAKHIVDKCKGVEASNFGLKAVKMQNCMSQYMNDKTFETNFV